MTNVYRLGDDTEKPLGVKGFRDRLAYRTNAEELWRTLLAPGVSTSVMKSIHEGQVTRSRLMSAMKNRQRGIDRLLEALEEGELDVVDEIMEEYNYRQRDIKRAWEMKQVDSSIRNLAGTTADRIDHIYRWWERDVKSDQEIRMALRAHVTDIDRLDTESLEKLAILGQALR